MLVRPAFLYSLLTISFLCIGSLIQVWLPSAGTYWTLALFLVLCTIAGIFLKNTLKQDGGLPAYIWLCLIYGGLIAGIGLIHALGLFMVPADMPINAEGVTAFKSFKMELYFTCIYLFFHIMLLGQYALARKLSMQVIIRLIVLAWVISLGVLLYQRFVDHSLLTLPLWNGGSRYAGLATDPNAFALTVFLLLPLLIIGIRMETGRLVKFAYMLLVLLLVPAEWFTGNRTAAGGICLFIILIPLMMACVNFHWSFRWRIAAGITPMLVLGLLLIVAPMLQDAFRELGGLGVRLAQSMQKMSAGGIAGLFMQGEARGWLYGLAWMLGIRSLWSGWGPGGWYREFSNLVYQQTGDIIHAFDSALNHYLILMTDFGLPVMLLNQGLILIPVVLGIIVFRRLEDVKLRFVVATLIAANCIFLLLINTVPPSYFLDVVWLWTAELAMLLVLAERHGVAFKYVSGQARKMYLGGAVIAILVIFPHAYGVAFGTEGYAARQQLAWWSNAFEKNCYPPEAMEGSVVRWCGKDAKLRVRVGKRFHGSRLVRHIKVTHKDAATRPVTVEYGTRHTPKRYIKLSDHAWHRIAVPVSAEDIETSEKGRGVRKYITLLVNVSRTWHPETDEGSGREFGVAVAGSIAKTGSRRQGAVNK